MAWVISIDEAGYGPNLGPLVMTSVACRLPDDLLDANLWRTLRTSVRKKPVADDPRLFIDDSKAVYSSARGIKELEYGVLAALPDSWTLEAPTLHRLLQELSAGCLPLLVQEPWYTGTSLLPQAADLPALRYAGQRFRDGCRRRAIEWGPVQSMVVCPSRFNQLLDQWGSKGAVLGHALADLIGLHQNWNATAERVFFIIDKHGGRNRYAPLLQHAFGEALVLAEEEGLERSSYRVLGLGRDVHLSFEVRADSRHLGVALASMVSKYLREVLMGEFNAFWKANLPDLKPTAGYPGDADRFFQEILPVAARLNIATDALWRRK